MLALAATPGDGFSRGPVDGGARGARRPPPPRGVIFNLANLLLVTAIAMTGLAVAFPIAIGTALIVGTALTFYVDSQGAPGTIALGVAFAACAILCCATAYRRQAKEIKLTRRGVTICFVSGLLMALWAPLAAESMQKTPHHLTPLSSLAVFGLAGPVLDSALQMATSCAGHGRRAGGCARLFPRRSSLARHGIIGRLHLESRHGVEPGGRQRRRLRRVLCDRPERAPGGPRSGVFSCGASSPARVDRRVGALAAMFLFYVAAIAVLSRAS